MNSLLSPAGAAVLARIARDRALLAFDFDGTLAPIVSDRRAANLRAETRALLRATALLYPCAVVSGRTRSDVAARVADVPLVAVVGNHGAEPGFGPVDRRFAARVRGWLERLDRALAAVDGVEVEDKRFSVAIHYRAARSWNDARRWIAAATAGLEDATIIEGHAVVNVVPREAPTKHDAIRALSERLGARRIVYVGDDLTDEDAFRAEAVGTAVRVGRSDRTSAGWFLENQAELDELLRALVAARAEADGRGTHWQGLVRAMTRPDLAATASKSRA